jgi:transcription-repair coupling factor (superfamily II helicase)
MRGAGELLGTRQHGYIASVGFHLYTRLLAQAVGDQRMARGMPLPDGSLLLTHEGHIPVNVELPLSIGIPVDYVADQNIRLRLYRRLADIQNESEVDTITEEYVDRFGPPPEPLRNLLYQIRVKLRAEAAGLASVSVEGDQMVLRFPPLPDGVASRNLPGLGTQVRAGKNAYWLPFTSRQQDWQQVLLETLAQIKEQL